MVAKSDNEGEINMIEFFNQIKESTLAWWILAIMAVVSLAWGIYSHYFSNNKQRFSVAKSSFEIIQQGRKIIKKLFLSYDEKEIHSLTVTKFAIWNSSKKVINGADMVSTQKLQVVTKGTAKILDAQIVTESERLNHFKVSERSSDKVSLDFEYVDSRDGIVLQVFHTGSSDKLQVEGKIKGGKPIKFLDAEKTPKRRNPKSVNTVRKSMAVLMAIELGLIIFMAVMVTLQAVGILPKDFLKSVDESMGLTNNSAFVIGLIWILVFMVFYLAIKMLREAFMVGVPSKLKSYSSNTDYS